MKVKHKLNFCMVDVLYFSDADFCRNNYFFYSKIHHSSIFYHPMHKRHLFEKHDDRGRMIKTKRQLLKPR